MWAGNHMKNLFAFALLANVAALSAEVPAQAATIALHFVGAEKSTVFGDGHLFTSGASSQFVSAGATGLLTYLDIPGGAFAVMGPSSAADKPLELRPSRGFRYNSFGGISFAGGDSNLGGNGKDAPEDKLLTASGFNSDNYHESRVKSDNVERTTLGIPELWTWAMIALGFVGSALAARRRKSSISAFD